MGEILRIQLVRTLFRGFALETSVIIALCSCLASPPPLALQKETLVKLRLHWIKFRFSEIQVFPRERRRESTYATLRKNLEALIDF